MCLKSVLRAIIIKEFILIALTATEKGTSFLDNVKF